MEQQKHIVYGHVFKTDLSFLSTFDAFKIMSASMRILSVFKKFGFIEGRFIGSIKKLQINGEETTFISADKEDKRLQCHFVNQKCMMILEHKNTDIFDIADIEKEINKILAKKPYLIYSK